MRLEWFYCSKNVKDSLVKIGVNTLLTSDDKRISYDLDQTENDTLLSTNCFNKNNMRYLRTNTRIEHITEPYVDIYKNRNKDTLVVFTHEWRLNVVNKYKLKRYIRLLKDNNYRFVN